MATLPARSNHWRYKTTPEQDAAARADPYSVTDWITASGGSATPTAGAAIQWASFGPSDLAEIVADTTPAISGLADLSATYGASVTINAALKSSGSNLVYSMTGPAWLSINPSTGSITGTAPSAGVSTTATVTVNNSAGSASDEFAVTVVDASGVTVTLSWDGDQADITADLSASIPGWIEGDVLEWQLDTTPDFAGSGNSSLGPIYASPAAVATSPLADGVYYSRARVVRGGTAHGWSNTVTITIDTPNIYVDSTAYTADTSTITTDNGV